MRTQFLLIGVLAGALGMASAPQLTRAQPAPLTPDPRPDSCVVYEHAEYSGRRLEVRAGEPLRWVGQAWNDRISSVACSPRCELSVSEHIDFGGARRVFGSTGFVGPEWNDRISAMQVSCERERWGFGPGRETRERACTVYWDANYAGRREGFDDGAEVAFIGPSWNDRVSAVTCRPGCRMTAYEHAEYQGASRDFTGATPFVGAAWNDRISALRVRCL